MTAKQNLETIERAQEAMRAGDLDAAAACYREDAVLRMAGVPAALGGRIEGRDAIRAFFATSTGTGDVEERDRIADDTHVCLINKLRGSQFTGNDALQGKDAPFSTLQCVVYRFDGGGQIAESTMFVNWMDVYTQTGLIDLTGLTR